MLKQRVITAVLLLAVLLPSLMASSPWPFALLTLVMIGAGGWEWGRLNAAGSLLSIAMGVLVAALCGLAWLAGWPGSTPAWVWWTATGAWVLGGAWALRGGPSIWPSLPLQMRRVVGVLVLCAAWLALASAWQRGLSFLLSTFCLVWMADIAAYFGGKAFGKRKLAPAISPGKSWEGVWSGLCGVLILAFTWTRLEPSGPGASLFGHLQTHLGVAVAVLAIVFLVALSVMGDLVESLAKRAAGMKDSSGLLPGHGGVLDRVDALLPVLPAAMALTSL